MVIETHGSFPLAGGELGARLAETHKAVGTDLFWELRDEDLYKSIGYRFGVVAANPDLESGAYNQWGWVSGQMANPTWFTPSGSIEPSRRQWVSTYWSGRITSEGKFRPYTEFGFSKQGDYGVKNTEADWQEFNRLQSIMIHARPEAPAGFGLVVSWPLQERRVRKRASQMGFGIFAHAEEQIDRIAGDLYQSVVKASLPVSFVASTDTLRKWKGTQPRLIADGYELNSEEIATLDRLSKAGTPIIAVGARGTSEERTGAEALYGAAYRDGKWEAVGDTETIPDGNGEPLAFVTRRSGRAPTLLFVRPTAALTPAEASELSRLSLELTANPLQVPPGIAVMPFIHAGSLFLTLGEQGDTARDLHISLRPEAFLKTSAPGKARVIDMDRALPVPSEWKEGRLHFSIPCYPNDGRLIQIILP